MALDPEALKALWPTEMPTIDIADKLGVHFRTIHNWAKKLDLPARTWVKERPKHKPHQLKVINDAERIIRESAARAATQELIERYTALSLRVQAERRAA